LTLLELSVPLPSPLSQTRRENLCWFTAESQEIIARNHFRPRDPTVAVRFADHYPLVRFFTIDDVFGDWRKAQPNVSTTAGSSINSISPARDVSGNARVAEDKRGTQ
jgi:ABC-type sulfate transport system substrate-binding protein